MHTKRLAIPIFFVLLSLTTHIKSQNLTAAPHKITAPVGSNTSDILITRSGGATFGGSGTYTWSVSPNVSGISWGGSASDNPRNLTFDATVPAGIYTVKVQRGAYSATATVEVRSPNFWAANTNGANEVVSFTINDGVFIAGPAHVFTTSSSTAAIGRSKYPSPNEGHFYWIPNVSNNGQFTMYARNGVGESNTAVISSYDLNGSSGNSLGYVRLGLDEPGNAWVLAGDGTNLYILKAKTNGLTAIPGNDISSTSVTLVGGNASSFQNGDLCMDRRGYIYVLANNSTSQSTEMYIGKPVLDANGNITSLTLTHKWDILDGSGNSFTGMVNGCCFDAAGGMYVSSTGNSSSSQDGIYYLDPATINRVSGNVNIAAGSSTTQADIVPGVSTINLVQLYQATGLTDLGTNIYPEYTPLPVAFGNINANYTNGQLSVDWQTLTEKNCKEYAVEVSNDGTTWKSVGKVYSKAIDGNSNTNLNYHFSTSLPITLAGFSLAFLLLGMVKSRILKITFLIVVTAIVIISCNKKSDVSVNNKVSFVRIAQYNVDGAIQHSQVVKVVNQ